MGMHEQIRELIPAYSLDCLDPAEAKIVAAHLQQCPDCQKDLESNLELVGKLALSIPLQSANPELKARILSAIHTPQPSPPAPEIQHSAAKPRPLSKGRWTDFFQRALPAWGVVSLLLIAVLSISNLRLAQRMNELEQGRPGFRTVQLSGTDFSPSAQGLLIISPDGENGSLVVDRMPALEDNQDYQLWLIKDGERTSGGVIDTYSDGYGVLWIHTDEPLISFEEIGVTIEPSGGSLAPSGEKIIGGLIE